jgi:hypothetical protein
MTESKSINIFSVQANSLYCVNKDIKFIKKDEKQEYKEDDPKLVLGKSVLPESLFLDYMRKHITSSTRNGGMCYDFVQIEFEDGYGGNIYQLVSDGETKKRKILKTSLEIRTDFYKNGVTIEWCKKDKEDKLVIFKTVSYKMLGRTPGKAKEGSCIFIREDLQSRALDYLTMNMYNKIPDENAPIVELSAYQMLTTAHAIDYMEIPWEQILVVQDEESFCRRSNSATVTKGMYSYESVTIDFDATQLNIEKKKFSFDKEFVKAKNEKGEEWTHVKRSHKSLENNGLLDDIAWKMQTKTRHGCIVDRNASSEFKNVLWDGMGIIDESTFPADMEGWIYCRAPFFKACLLRGDIQEYYRDYCLKSGKDYETATVLDMFGNIRRLKDIKMITTNNALKWLKFKDLNLMGNNLQEQCCYYANFLKEHGNRFSIVKTGHISEWEGGLQRSSYQMMNSLPCVNKDTLKKIVQPSIGYIDNLKINLSSFMYHLKVTGNDYKINNVLIDLNKWNDKFKDSSYFAGKRKTMISKFNKKEVQAGKIMLPGDNLTMFGNPIALLMKAVGEDYTKEGCFEASEDWIECYTNRFSAGEKLAGFRSPHNSPNNVVHFKNVQSDVLDKYFPNIGRSVIIVNCLHTDIQDRTNGCDFDSDYLFVTDQAEVVKLAEQAYRDYPTIINNIPLVGNSNYKKDMESYAIMDDKIMSAQIDIGKSSNVAQLALSYYYDKGIDNIDAKKLEDVFIICSVLAQAAVDSSKRVYDVKIRSEVNRLQNMPWMKYDKSCKKVYPKFFAKEQEKKGNTINSDTITVKEDMNCPMDIMAKIIDESIIDLREHPKYKSKNLSNRCFFEYKAAENKLTFKRKQKKQFIDAVEEYRKIEKSIVKDDNDDCAEKLTREFKNTLEKVSKMKLSKETMATLIAVAFDDTGAKKKMQRERNKISDKLLIFLYNYNKDDKTDFLNCFKKTEKECH